MSKITKKEYNAKVKEVETSIILFEGLQKKYVAIVEDEESEDNTKDHYGLLWNSCQDAIYVLNKELKDLEHDYFTINWTSQDWSEHSLVCNNID